MALLVRFALFVLINIALFSRLSLAGDAVLFLDFKVSYTTASPLGVPEKVRFF